MQISIIISYYKALDNLRLILAALDRQSSPDFEVIVSEDDHNPETITFFEAERGSYSFSISHIFQEEDRGFRKNKMLNRAIVTSKSDFLVFIDGDCIPHRHFVKQYAKNARRGYMLMGRRVMLSDAKSKSIKKSSLWKNLRFFTLLFSDTKKLKEAIYSPFLPLSWAKRGIIGCNWGVYKQHLLEVNGFDEDYEAAGVGEDTDMEWRLRQNGLKLRSVKNKAIVYHLFHPKLNTFEDMKSNFDLFEEVKKFNRVKCLNGLEKL